MQVDHAQLNYLLRQGSLIWNSKQKDFKNRDAKVNAWHSIGEVMNL